MCFRNDSVAVPGERRLSQGPLSPKEELVERAEEYDSAIPDELPFGPITYPLYLETEDRRRRGLPTDVLSLANTLHFSVDQLRHVRNVLLSGRRSTENTVRCEEGDARKDYRVAGALLIRVLAESFRFNGGLFRTREVDTIDVEEAQGESGAGTCCPAAGAA